MAVTTGKGTLLQHGIFVPGSPPTVTYTTIGQRTKVGSPNLQNSEKDRTTLDSLCKVMAAALLDPGELALTIQYDATDLTHKLLTDLVVAGTDEAWRVVFNDATVITNRTHIDFTGFVKGFAPTDAEVEVDILADVTIRVNSVPVITAHT